MMFRTTIAALVLSGVSGLALAQTTAPTAPSTLPNTTAPASTMQDGMKMADTATVALRFMAVKPADLMSSRIVGANVYNNQNETLGEVQDLVINDGKTVSGVVVSVGGFLGMGESYVVLDPSTIVVNQKDNAWRVHVNTSKESLKNAPKFAYKKAG